jgi:hypothetical protein
LPNAGLWISPNTGHTINLEEPAAFNAHLETFLGPSNAEAGAVPMRRRGSVADASVSNTSRKFVLRSTSIVGGTTRTSFLCTQPTVPPTSLPAIFCHECLAGDVSLQAALSPPRATILSGSRRARSASTRIQERVATLRLFLLGVLVAQRAMMVLGGSSGLHHGCEC